MKNIRHIFFDLDNTIWDHRKNAYLTLKEIYRRENIQKIYRIPFEEFHKEYFTINENLWAQIRDGKITKEYLRKHRFYDSFMFFGVDDEALGLRFEHNFLDEILSYNELVPGAFEILEYLSEKDYKLHILSNGFHEVTYKKAELSGIKNYFQTITSADEINVRKPQPEIFRYALGKAQAQRDSSVMIGDDWIADVRGAKSFGMAQQVFFDVFNDEFSGDGIISIRKLDELRNYY